MSRPNRNESIERKVAVILAMPDAPKKTIPKPVKFSVNGAISVLERMDKKIEVAMYLSKN